ncbi:hypothetical protein F5Y14DRAFT_457060 [Nemania sp. NC0429]|nr:hypothetical protein F5Y14DRAFT_457060 [Nemania sp. NC0429]
MKFLETVLSELGIPQYLSLFVDQGFDSWETLLDITESDLDALGVKLGHRRKLQRRIANYRGVAPDASLASATRTSIEDARYDATRGDVGRSDGKIGLAAPKRKYRRHPKADEHAPERPPSAYVLFSNKMREDLKGQNLTFTEIAKLVGENWQNLGRAEKAPYERQANEAKEAYNHDLAEYKKTSECKKYNEYLREFRKRQAAQTQEKDAAKRLKTDGESIRGSSTSGGSIGPGGTTSGSGTGSGSESQHGSEPPPSRQQRLGSITSMSTGTSYADDPLTSPTILAQEESNFGRGRGLSSHSLDVSSHSVGHRGALLNGHGLPGDVAAGSGVPWLDPRTTPLGISQSPEAGASGMHPGQGQGAQMNKLSRGSGSSGSMPFSQRPSLPHEHSSPGSTSHGSISYGSSSHNSISSTSSRPPRTPSDASLPIHALLSSGPGPPAPYMQSPPPHLMNGQTSQAPLSLHPSQQIGNLNGFRGSMGFSNGTSGPVSVSRPNYPGTALGSGHDMMANLSHESNMTTMNQAGHPENGLDGISALLRARDIVDRRP